MTAMTDLPRIEIDALAVAKRLEGLLSPASTVRRNEPMARRTTLRVGGPADVYVEPATEEDLVALVRFCAAEAIPLFALGRGSNLLVRDGGIRGVVVCLAQPQFRRIEFAGGKLACGAGARLKEVALAARQHSQSGLEFLEGIPGSVGGALRMNAGAMGGALFDVVESVRLLDRRGMVSVESREELRPVYRSCPSLRESFALSAVLRTHAGDDGAIQARMNEYSRKRWASQPAAPSAGCIFKNPASIPAGRLIDELGLKGTRVGGARVSSEHGNFIVNDGQAIARDVLDLIEHIRTAALRERGIRLETEVEIIGQ